MICPYSLDGSLVLISCLSWRAEHVFRECNESAHSLAKWAEGCNAFGTILIFSISSHVLGLVDGMVPSILF